jgi:hypothetical protein
VCACSTAVVSFKPSNEHLHLLQEPLLPSTAQQLPDPEPLLFKYLFREPLTEGVIIKKRKRFTAKVLVDGQVIVAHCPTTCLSLYQTLLNGQQVPSGLRLCFHPASPILEVATGQLIMMASVSALSDQHRQRICDVPACQ